MAQAAKRRLVHLMSNVEGLKETFLKLRPKEWAGVEIVDINADQALSLWESKGEVEPTLVGATVLCSEPQYFSNMVHSMPHLEWLTSLWAGNEKLLASPQFTDNKPSFILSRQGGVFGEPMAQYVAGQIIARERFFREMDASQRDQTWEQDKYGRHRSMRDLSIGVLGFGDIGAEVGRLCKAMGMTVWALVRSSRPPADVCDHAVKWEGLGELLASCDYVCNVLPSTPATVGRLGGDTLAPCRHKKSCFINVGRGDIITEADLINALKQGWLGSAVLDVVEREPLPRDSPLWSMPNVVISPHISGASNCVGAVNQFAKVFWENYSRYAAGERVKYQVDLETGY